MVSFHAETDARMQQRIQRNFEHKTSGGNFDMPPGNQ